MNSNDDDDDNHEFNFPYEPYNIQIELMKTAYDSYENKKFALLESPTGTGKSLSLICSALTWLRDHQNKTKQDLVSKKAVLANQIDKLKEEEEKSGDWLKLQTKRQDVSRELSKIDGELDKIIEFEKKNEARRHAKVHNHPFEEYSALNGNDENEDIEKKISEQNENHIRPKIYYASRTHSQLSQFISEIKKTKFADTNLGPSIKVTPLASRANLCVNQEVLKLKDSNAINEKCMEMSKESKADKRCPYVKAKQVFMLKEDILSSVQDIEDIVSRGKVMGSCPYYAARMAIPEAEVVVLPYNNLMHHETRKASSLDLNDSVVIIDEAHNILETICSLHSAPILGQHLISSHTILSRYYRKFHNRMSPKNAEVIKTIVNCLTALIKYLDAPKQHIKDYECKDPVSLDDDGKDDSISNSQHAELMIDVTKFIGAAKIEQFNVFKIIDYFSRSQLARKLIGFYKQDNSIDLSIDLCDINDGETKLPATKKRKLIDETTKNSNLKHTHLGFLKKSNPKFDETTTMSYPIYTLVEFLKSLTNLAQDGKVLTNFCSGAIQQSILKFILLNPASQFQQMTQEARSIVLAGGTMQPFEEFIDLLYGPLKIDRNRLTLFSCGHVIGAAQLFVATLTNGSTGKPLELSYKTKNSNESIDEIGRTISNISIVVPGGMVCFFPSYDYEQICFKRWTQTGVISTIETKAKQVFREPRQTSHLKPVLDEYSRTVEKGKSRNRGAMLLCVVGGKMSEGINFNDDLGRCIVMIGLPYANIKSSELQQKIAYYDKTCSKKGMQISAGQQYYENLCIKGINQSIGRAIRHKDDYSSIILLDRRYSSKNSIRNGLSGWMRQELVDYEKFGPMLYKLKVFFNNMATK